jgi:hypothetical protein
VKSTEGWQLCVNWNDGSTSWEHLTDVKEACSIQVSEHAVGKDLLVSQPVFAWWVPFTLKKRDQVIKAVNSRCFRHTHKFGIKLPKTVEERSRLTSGPTRPSGVMPHHVRRSFGILTGDIQNGCLNVPCEEHVWTICGAEFGESKKGAKAIIVCALHGLKSAGASFRNLLADCLGHLGCTSCKADPDVWLRPIMKPDGFECYE